MHIKAFRTSNKNANSVKSLSPLKNNLIHIKGCTKSKAITLDRKFAIEQLPSVTSKEKSLHLSLVVLLQSKTIKQIHASHTKIKKEIIWLVCQGVMAQSMPSYQISLS